MASLVRPAVLRQTMLVTPSKRLFQSRAAPISTSVFSKTPLQSATLKQSFLARTNVPSACRVAAFHATGRRALLPPLPQRINGTANEAAPVPTPSPTHGNYHWDFERLVSAALIPVTIAPFAGGVANPLLDAALCGLLLVHSHIGFQAIIIDYLPAKRVPKTRSLFEWGLRAGTLVVAIGLYEFETNDVGVTEAIKRIWTA